MAATTNFFTALINTGIRLPDAEELEKAFATEPDFLDGLEQVATILALKQNPGTLPPTGEPWHSVFTSMASDMAAGVDVDQAFRNALVNFDPIVQSSIANAVGIRMQAVLDFEAQKGNKKRYKTKDYLLGLKQLGYTFKLNECNDSIEVNGEPLNDAQAAKIRCQMRDAGFVHTVEMEDSYFADAYVNRYHPVREFLSNLSYDGGHYIDDLASHIQDQHGVFPTWLRKWMIGSCAKVFEGEQNAMLVLDGPQGIGKSEFVKWLAKPLTQYFIEAPINPDDKDTDIRLISRWIWEVSELGATTRKADYEALKAFLTKREVTVRKPYGRHDIRKPAMASFVGTVNNSSGILSDPTGNRRFLICKLLSIDWAYSQLDPAQVWGEAMAAYLAHESWTLSVDEKKKANEINEQYEVDDVIEGLLKKFFKVDPTDNGLWTPTADILKVLEDPYQGGLKGTSKGNSMMLAGTMTKLGMQKIKKTNMQGQRVWGYVGIELASRIP